MSAEPVLEHGLERAERPSSDTHKPPYAQYDAPLSQWVRCEQGVPGARQFSRFHHLFYLEDPTIIPQDEAAAALQR